MWGRGFQQRAVEELALLEAGHSRKPGGPVGRRGLGGIGAITLAGAVALAVLVGDCSNGQGQPTGSPSPSPLSAAVAAGRMPATATGS